MLYTITANNSKVLKLIVVSLMTFVINIACVAQSTNPAISDTEINNSATYTTTVTDYCGNFVYENGKLARILFDGGFITFPEDSLTHQPNTSKPIYHFYFTDHLGNIRVVTDAEGNIEQINDYYPYGGLMHSGNAAVPTTGNQPYRYNGKELDRINNLDRYDYGARMYDGFTWNRVDPLAENYYDISPYSYCLGNPIINTDPDGRWVKPGDFFRTKNAAAVDFGMLYNDNSIRDNREYMSYIVKVRDSKGNVGYTYTIAHKGTEDHVTMPSVQPRNTVAIAHTHGRYIKGDQNNSFSGTRNTERIVPKENYRFVKAPNVDLGVANTRHLDMYVSTPNGSLQKYNHRTGEISTISTDMPSDPKDPERLNNNNAYIEHTQTTISDMLNMISNVMKLIRYGK